MTFDSFVAADYNQWHYDHDAKIDYGTISVMIMGEVLAVSASNDHANSG